MCKQSKKKSVILIMAYPDPDHLCTTRLDAILVSAARRRLPLLCPAVGCRVVVYPVLGLHPQGTTDLLWADCGQG